MPVPYPQTESGVELRLLQRMFSPTEAGVALHLSAVAESVEVIFRRMIRTATGPRANSEVKEVLPDSPEDLRELLDDLARRGSINYSIEEQKGRRVRTYGLAPLVVGMFEFQVDKLTPEYVNDFQQYLDEGFRSAVVGARTAQLRTVPVGHALASARAVGTHADIRTYIRETEGPFAVINCVCRQSSMMQGIECSNSSTIETCLTLGKAAENGIETGKARALTRDGVLEILDRAEREGHVIQPQNARDPMFICCCDRDCCEVLQNARKLPKPAEAVATTHQAHVDAAACIACGLCVKRCPMDAVRLPEGSQDEGKGVAPALVDPDRCIGCGLCVSTCPKEAITLKLKENVPVPAKTPTGMYLRMYRDRFGLGFLIRTAIRKLLGRKI